MSLHKKCQNSKTHGVINYLSRPEINPCILPEESIHSVQHSSSFRWFNDCWWGERKNYYNPNPGFRGSRGERDDCMKYLRFMEMLAKQQTQTCHWWRGDQTFVCQILPGRTIEEGQMENKCCSVGTSLGGICFSEKKKPLEVAQSRPILWLRYCLGHKSQLRNNASGVSADGCLYGLVWLTLLLKLLLINLTSLHKKHFGARWIYFPDCATNLGCFFSRFSAFQAHFIQSHAKKAGWTVKTKAASRFKFNRRIKFAGWPRRQVRLVKQIASPSLWCAFMVASMPKLHLGSGFPIFFSSFRQRRDSAKLFPSKFCWLQLTADRRLPPYLPVCVRQSSPAGNWAKLEAKLLKDRKFNFASSLRLVKYL